MRDFKKTGLALAPVLLCLFMFLPRTDAAAQGKPNIVHLKDYPAENAMLDTLRVGFFKELNLDMSFWGREYPGYSEFYSKGDESSVKIFEKRPEMKYKVWMQEKDKKAPLVVIIPGTAVQYNGESVIALAQIFYEKGFSVASISNPLNWEFMESASSVDIPGFMMQDAADIYNTLQILVPHLKKEYPDRISTLVLAGYSLGALHTLIISDIDGREKKIGFSRFVSINPPVTLMYSMGKIDSYYEKWREWPIDKIQYNMNEAADVYIRIIEGAITPAHKLDITQDEAEFVIGYAFRLQLSEAIFSIYKRGKDMGNIKEPYRLAKDKIYREIRRYSYRDYVNNFLLKYYSEKLGGSVLSVEELSEKSGLRAIGDSLSKNPDIRIFHNLDDFIISDSDREWLSENIGDRVTFFDRGGHLGNLYIHEVQKKIVDSVIDLVPPEPKKVKKDDQGEDEVSKGNGIRQVEGGAR